MWLRSPSPEATQAAGRLLGEVLRDERDAGVVALVGELGAGKTVFAKGFAAGLGIDPRALASPTFVLVHEHAAPDGRRLAHVDCYRLRSAAELEAAGFLDLLAPGVVAVVEWGDRFPDALPADHLRIELARVSGRDSQRRLSAVASGPSAAAWLERWQLALRRRAAESDAQSNASLELTPDGTA